MSDCTGHSPGETQAARKVGVSMGEIECAEDSDYIKPETVVGSPVYGWSVIGPLGVTPAETPDAQTASVSLGEIACAEDSGYIRRKTVVHLTVYVASVTESLLPGSPFRRVLGLPQPTLPSRGLTWITLADCWFSCRLVSGKGLPAVNQAGATMTATNPLLGTFLGVGLDLGSDKLYDLVGDIPDVMGLRALQPSAAIVKVMSVPNSLCIRIVTADDYTCHT